MKIAFFEIEDWEKEYLQNKLSNHELYFSSQPLTHDVASQIKDYDIISVFIYSSVTKDIIELFTNLKLIATRSTGFDHIDVAFCKEKNIAVVNVPVYGTHTVAQHTFALILAISRKLIPSVERTRRGDFSLEGLRGSDLFEKTLGVVGVGDIGKAVIRIAHGFGMRVIAYTAHPKEEVAKELDIEFVSFPDLLHKSDVVTLHVPYTPATHHLINNDNISLFKKGSILINTARGGLVETEAMLRGLDLGILSGIGIDVLEEEGMIKEERQLLTKQFVQEKEADYRTQLLNHVLLNRENVLVTPHNAFNSTEALHRILDTTIDNIVQFMNNQPTNVIAV